MGLADYIKKREIGKGSFGVVFLTECKHDRKRYVVKRIALERATTKEQRNAFQEAKLLSTLNHPNIVSHRESFISKDNAFLYIVMQYCEGGDLYTRLRQQAATGHLLPETQIMDWFVQIGLALQYLHDKNIMHRDLKTQNIFLTKKQVVKVGDLGIARVLDSEDDMATTVTGTPYYMSPELYARVPYNIKSDVWSFGCVMYEVATLKKAFNAKDYNALAFKVSKGQIQRLPSAYPDDMDTLFASMLAVEPDDRPTVKEILGSPYARKHMHRFVQQFAQRKAMAAPRSTSLPATPTDAVSASTKAKAIPQSVHRRVSTPREEGGSPASSRSSSQLATPTQDVLRQQRRLARQRKSMASQGEASSHSSSTIGSATPRNEPQQPWRQGEVEARHPANTEIEEEAGDDDDSEWEVSTDDAGSSEDEQEDDGHTDSTEPIRRHRRNEGRAAEAAQDELDETTCAELLELQLSFDVASALSPSPDVSFS
ncbi:NEK protein kinase [Salpingoeca rosetta]|uniref:non-specific serine/threonine protein kinase n=1 Tax=Salpingoeca rosetta (strain ATCC 50818 / BSB-021) TaxID=946362 RepID=F2U502_SALR5|nr:NEK protein kinase [Salpingoeca rosetta]EGD82718.1 NEK protein kinase [Salpingoeca rosetta]|eukprot:XP_004995954.1 NEK protein kinase [Salpingoeca rosetta]